MTEIAWAAMILWPILSIIFFKKMSLPVALCTTIIGGYLLLPRGISLNLPVLPTIDKDSIPTLTAVVLTAVTLRNPMQSYPVLPGWIPRSYVVLGLLAMLGTGVLGTVATNGEILVYGPRVLERLGVYDAFSTYLDLLIFLAPLFLARRVLSSPEGQRVLLVALAVSALVYTLPSFYEIRMSPQLHKSIYGISPSSFAQAMRDGGFRPMVFIGHGLSLSIFLTLAIIAAAGLFRATKSSARWKWAFAMVWLFFTLVLSKSLGALLISCVLLPVALFLRPRMQLMAAACIAGVVLTFPLLRAADLIPVDRVLAFAESIDEGRASSFKTRIVNEENLLAKARKKPAFGWGQWGRYRVFDEEGRDTSITDGLWIIQFGLGGWFRYIPIFGLLCWPLLGLFFGRRANIDPVCAVLAVALSAKLVDLIPNTGMTATYWLIVGSLIGRLEMKLGTKHPVPQEQEKPVPQSAYVKEAILPGRKEPDPKPRYARAFPQKEGRKEVSTENRSAPQPRDRNLYRRPKPTPGYRG